MRFSVAIKDNWWLVESVDQPQAVLSVGWWLPPLSAPPTQEQIAAGERLTCLGNVTCRKSTRQEALAIIMAMTDKAQADDDWYLTYIESGPRANDALLFGRWHPLASDVSLSEAEMASGLPFSCGANTLSRRVDRHKATSILAAMHVCAEDENMIQAGVKA